MIVLLGFGVSQVNAQRIKESEVPQAVRTSFTKAYPRAKEVKWDKEDGAFEASFDQNKTDMSVLLDEKGMVKEVETHIEKTELPKAIQETIAKEFPGYKINETAKILTKGITTYEAEVKKEGKTFDLIFDINGKLLKKIDEETKKEDKD